VLEVLGTTSGSCNECPSTHPLSRTASLILYYQLYVGSLTPNPMKY
jgi:hypothetical protein